MGYAAFGWQNWVTGGTLTASTSLPGLDTSQLQQPLASPSTAWQAASLSNVTLIIDAGAPVSWQAFGLFRTNLTSSATVRWQVATDAAITSLVYDSTTVNAGVVSGFAQSIIVAPSAATGRYCKVRIDDGTNPDGFLNIPKVYAGPLWTPAVNPSWQSSLGRAVGNAKVVTRGGQTYVNLYWSQRVWRVQLQGIKAAEVWPNVMDLDGTARLGSNVLFIADKSSANIGRETVFGYCEPTSDLTFALQSLDARGWTATISERL